MKINIIKTIKRFGCTAIVLATLICTVAVAAKADEVETAAGDASTADMISQDEETDQTNTFMRQAAM